MTARARTPRTPDRHTTAFVEKIAVLLEADGLPRVAGRLFGLLLVSAEPRSLDDLAKQLGLSKASISINARLLEEKGVVERTGRQADRRDYYSIAEDILERTLEQRMAKIRRFQQSIAEARATCTIDDEIVRARLENMDMAHNHLLDATARALDEWRTSRGKRMTPPTARTR
jgi:DNA-binding transcriptional regulator GbsR (MarR family)